MFRLRGGAARPRHRHVDARVEGEPKVAELHRAVLSHHDIFCVREGRHAQQRGGVLGEVTTTRQHRKGDDNSAQVMTAQRDDVTLARTHPASRLGG